MKVFVSGATGFVASHLIPALVSSGHEVVAAGHDRARIPGDATPLHFDLTAPDWPTLPSVDAVVHLAQANVPFPGGANALFAVNVTATQRLLEHARRTGARRFVLASSGSVYGASPGPLTEDSPLAARDYYSATKVAAERFAQAYDGQFEIAIFRLFVPYGPGQVRRMMPRLVERIRSGEPIELNREGRPRMNPIYVEDVVQLVLRALDDEGGSLGVLNVAGDDVIDIRRVSELIGEILGIEPHFEAGDGDAADIVADNARMHAFLGDAHLVPMRDGLERTVASEHQG
jgi:nucleoside-diphosphate-sugar epimerase